MKDHHDLRGLLGEIDGRGYKAYEAIGGAWRFDDFVLNVDHVQGDPFAAPSRMRVVIEPDVAGFPEGAWRGSGRATGTACMLAHAFAAEALARSRSRGSGRSGEITMMHPGQLVLATTAVRVGWGTPPGPDRPAGTVEARFGVGLPAGGRRIDGTQAIRLLLEDVPEAVRGSLLARAHDAADVERHAAAAEDAEALREALRGLGLVAFVADGALLPRRSGVDDRPLEGDDVVPFRAPEALRRTIELPNAGAVTGMGVPEGVTLVVGGGFHGKSTLLRALQDGVWNHRPGDGRELVATRADAVKIRAEDGRSIAGVDISGFIDGLPLGRTTTAFTTPNGSGSTSQAAAIVEALEAGAGVLLVDEDTSATNFMIRDRRMQALVPPEAEPITPFVDRARELHERLGVSTVLVVGGSGDYLDVADRVIRMADYRPEDVTEAARAVAREHPTGRRSEAARPFRLRDPHGKGSPAELPRRLRLSSVDPSRGRRARYVRVPDDRTLLFGSETIDLAAVEQLVLPGQIRTVGEALAWMASQGHGEDEGGMPMEEILSTIEHALASGGLDAVAEYLVGDLAMVRRFEVAAALNRLRALRVVEPFR